MRLTKEQWAEARVRYETDASVTCASLAREFGCTRQAIDNRRRKEQWEKADPQMIEVASNFPIVETSDKATPESLAQFLNCMSLMRNEELACNVIGVDVSTVYRWKKQDEAFAKAVQVARARKVTSWLETVDRAAQRDYKAALELLKRAPETREVFGETQERGPQIVLNIVRD